MHAETSLTQRMAAWAAGLHETVLPDAVIAQALTGIADLLLVAAAGSVVPAGRAVRQTVPATGGPSQVWFHDGLACTPEDAAFVNTWHAATLDYDSLNGAMHADLICLPAAWSAAEAVGASGRQMLLACVASSELLCRLAGAARGSGRGWSATSLYGAMGAALASGLVRGLPVLTLRHALGLGAAQPVGSQQANVEQVLSKRLQPALAVRHGVFAARLAAAGVSAPALALEGPYGMRALTEQGDDHAALDGLGDSWRLLETGFKRYPVCAGSHAAVQACLAARAQLRVPLTAVRRVTARISALCARLVGAPFSPDGDPGVTAQFNLRYHLACVLVHGRLGLDEIEPQALRDPAVRALIARVEIVIEPGWADRLDRAEIVVEPQEGAVVQTQCHVLPGSPAAPLTAAEHRDKRLACAARVPSLGVTGAHALLARLDALIDWPDMRTFWQGIIRETAS